MSYTSFALDCKPSSTADADTTAASAAANFTFACEVANGGAREGDEVIMAFHRVSDDMRKQIGSKHPVPLKRLVEFDRVSLAAGAKQQLTFTIPRDRLTLTTATGDQMLYPGEHELIFSRGTGEDVVLTVAI